MKKLLLCILLSVVMCQAKEPEVPAAVSYAGPPTVKGQILHKTRRFKRWVTPARAIALAAALAGAGIGGAAFYGYGKALWDDNNYILPSKHYWFNPVGWGYNRYRATHSKRPMPYDFIGPAPLAPREEVEAELRRRAG